MKKLPNGVSNYEDIVKENRIYVDKTMYIEKIENLANKTIMFLRPRKFGKTLFTSTLGYYYDKLKKDEFNTLFKDTYIGKNPTENRNRYCILKFNFSGIDTTNSETTLKGFREKCDTSIRNFIIKYGVEFNINPEQSTEGVLNDLFNTFYLQKESEKIYVIIDEYDHFANTLLGTRTDEFKHLLSEDGKVRKWYEVLKQGTETVVDRIFITGVAPITLDSTTSGFNIATDLTRDLNFNDMLGFSTEDVKYLMNELEIDEEKQKELLPIMKENYDGYIFSNAIKENYEKYKMYNSNMTLYFLDKYVTYNEIPEELIDINIISDYRKIEGYMNLCKEEGKMEILEKIAGGIPVEEKLIEKFNPEKDFKEQELISLLYYLGYITIAGKGFTKSKFVVPNDVIRKIYLDYYMQYISKKAKINAEKIDTEAINEEILIYGKIEKLMEILGEYLIGLSNRDYRKFDEKYVKIILYTICKMLESVVVKSEQELSGNYADILLIPKEKIEERYGILIEMKYLKQEDYDKDNSLLEKKEEEAKEQLLKYKESEEVKVLKKLRCYTIVAIKDKLVVKEY